MSLRSHSKTSSTISDGHIRAGARGASTQHVGIPVATCPFPDARAPASEIQVIPPNPIALRKDVFVVCASRDLNDQPFGPLWEPEFGPTVFTGDAEDPRATDLWRGGGRSSRRLLTGFRNDFCFIHFLRGDQQCDRRAGFGF